MRVPELVGFPVEVEHGTEVGHFGIMEGDPIDGANTSERCPLCDGPLMEAQASAYRLVRLNGLQGLAQKIPPTHRALACEVCEVGFTLPRAGTV